MIQIISKNIAEVMGDNLKNKYILYLKKREMLEIGCESDKIKNNILIT